MDGPSSTPARFGALSYRNYRLFFVGQIVSLAGTWMQQVAQAWLVLELTHDPFMLGVVAAAQFLPVVLLGLFGGLVADQLPKRQTILATQVVSMVLAFALYLLTATGTVDVAQIVVLALLLGAANAVEMPTRQSFVIEMVGRENLGNAVGLNSAVFNGARIVGPAVAGLTIAAFDISVAFLVNGLTFLAAIAALSLMRDEELRRGVAPPRPHGLREVARTVAEGLRYVRQTPIVLLAVVVVSLVATFGMNFSVLVPSFAQQVLRTEAVGFGFLMTASGVGSVITALAIAFGRRTSPLQIAAGALVLGFASLVLAATAAFAVAMVALFVIGAGAIAMMTVANTTIQLYVPDQLRGRVLSVYTTVFAGSIPVGGLLSGFVASTWGVPAALALGGAISAVVGLAALAWLRAIGTARWEPASAARGSPQPDVARETSADRRPTGPAS